MAKLEGVKTLDMVDGQITKVEYGGAVYEKVEGDAKEGDLIYTTERDEDTLANEFYEIVPDDRYGGITFFDEAEDECDIHLTFYKTFRKVSESDLPTVEEVNAKVDELAERVDALEGSKPVPIIKVGNRVKALTDGQFYDIKSGEIGEVTDTDVGLSGDDPYSIRVDTEDDHDYFRPQDLELVTEDDEEETERPTVGDVVKVVRDESGHRAKIGDVVTIVEDEHDDHPYKCKFLDGTHAGWFYESEVQKISEETIEHNGAEYTLVDRKAQPGDVVVFMENTSCCFENNKPYGPVKQDERGELAISSHEGTFAVYFNIYDRTPDNVKVYAPVAKPKPESELRTVKRKARVGERILNIEPFISLGRYKKGDELTVVESIEERQGVSGHIVAKENGAKILDREYEVIVEEVATLKVGDTVKLNVKGTPKFGWGDVSNGEVGEIKEEGSDGRMYVDFPSQKGWMADPSELVLTTVEEVKLEAIGRKPGEIKKGDIVRTKRRDGRNIVGIVTDIADTAIGVDAGGEYRGVYFDEGDEAELIAPVESRVDV